MSTDKSGATVSPHAAAMDKCYRPGNKPGSHTFHWSSLREDEIICMVCGEVRKNSRRSHSIVTLGYQPINAFEAGESSNDSVQS